MTSQQHILSKEGVLVAFSIAKKIYPGTLQQIKKKLKNTKMSKKKFDALLTQKVIEETNKAIAMNKVPGLEENKFINENEKKLMMELTYFSSLIAKKITDKNIDKFHSCYIINSIISMLNLTSEDFDDFHKLFDKYRNGETDDGEDFDGESDEY